MVGVLPCLREGSIIADMTLPGENIRKVPVSHNNDDSCRLTGNTSDTLKYFYALKVSWWQIKSREKCLLLTKFSYSFEN